MEVAELAYACPAIKAGLARFRKRLLVACAVMLLFSGLVGCASGPDFVRPAAPDGSDYTRMHLPKQMASAIKPMGKSQQFQLVQEVDAQWWRKLGSARLDALIATALSNNPDLAAAQAALRQAKELRLAQAGATRYPQMHVDTDAQRQRMSPSAQGQMAPSKEFGLYNASVGVHYQFDLAGGNRRALEALSARSDYRRYESDGVRLVLVANITTTAILRAKLAAQLNAKQAVLAAQNKQINITEERLRLGQASAEDLLLVRGQAEQTQVNLSVLRKQFEQSEHSLAVLSGQEPTAADIPNFTLDEFNLPTDLPLVLPSELVRRRSDIQAAESLLHAATADYGVAVASLYPQINLGAQIGSQALTAGALFGGSSAIWGVLGQLTQPLFYPGLSAKKRASLAALDAATANYRSVVLGSLRDVADVLRALDYDAQTWTALAAADRYAQLSLESVVHQYKLGVVGYERVLVAQQQAQQSHFALADAQAQHLADSVALYQSLGGGRTGTCAEKQAYCDEF